jgi:hypothetical protein
MALSVASGAPCVTSAAFRHMRYRDGTSDSELQDRVGELRGESRLAISLLSGTAHLLVYRSRLSGHELPYAAAFWSRRAYHS